MVGFTVRAVLDQQYDLFSCFIVSHHVARDMLDMIKLGFMCCVAVLDDEGTSSSLDGHFRCKYASSLQGRGHGSL